MLTNVESTIVTVKYSCLLLHVSGMAPITSPITANKLPIIDERLHARNL